jgi:hypothetical protein
MVSKDGSQQCPKNPRNLRLSWETEPRSNVPQAQRNSGIHADPIARLPRLLLKYSARDEVELLKNGKGGVLELRAAIAAHTEESPLYGFLRFRRKSVLLKYIPEGTSRLLQGKEPLSRGRARGLCSVHCIDRILLHSSGYCALPDHPREILSSRYGFLINSVDGSEGNEIICRLLPPRCLQLNIILQQLPPTKSSERDL